VAKRPPQVICGKQSLSCSSFNLVFSTFRTALPPVASLLSLRERYKNHGDMDLTSLLYFTAHVQSTDPKDMIYALLGLAREVDRKSILPDYSKRCSRVCCEVVKHLIQHDESLKVLSRTISKHDTKLPSWVPDFSIPAGRGGLWLWDEHAEYAASGNTKPLVRFSDDIRTLFIRGLIVDMVMHVYGPFNTENEVLESLPSMINSVCSLIRADAQDLKVVKRRLKRKRKRKRSIEELGESVKADSGKKINAAIDQSATCNSTDRPPSHLGTPSAVCEALRKTATLAYTGERSEEVLRRCFLRKIVTNARQWLLCSGSDIQVEQQMMPTLVPRCFFTTSNRYIGIGPKRLQPGDKVCILFGGDAYYILRDHDEYQEFRGDAYMHQAMKGELLDTWIKTAQSSPPTKEFVLR
jgi:hypothetical protein